MSNVEKNNTGLNCVSNERGTACRVEMGKEKRNSRSQNYNEEIASEFVVDATLENVNNFVDQSGNKFEPNKEKTVSERSAWN